MKMCPKCYTIEEGKPLERNSFHIKEQEKNIKTLESNKGELKKVMLSKIKEFKKYLNESKDAEAKRVWTGNLKALEKEHNDKIASINSKIDIIKQSIKDLKANKFIIKGYKCSVCGNIHSFKLN